MIHILRMIFGAALYYIFSLVKIVSSAGQTYFGSQQTAGYILKNTPPNIATPATIALSSTACIFKVGTTLLTSTPALYEQYRVKDKNESSNETEAPIEFVNKRGTVASFIMQSAAIGSTLTGPILGTYFGMIVLMKLLASLVKQDNQFTNAEEIGIQVSAATTAIMMFGPYFAFDFKKITRPGCRMFAKLIDEPSFSPNRNTAKTIITALPMLISGPAFAYYWTKPTLEAFPPVVYKFIGDKGTLGIAAFSAATGFISTLSSLPLLYQYFSNTIKVNYPDTKLAKTLCAASYFTGIGDAAAGSLVAFTGTVKTVEGIFGIDPYHPGAIVMGVVIAGSTLALSTTFGLNIGYHSLMQSVYAPKPETENAVIDEEEKRPLLSDTDAHDESDLSGGYEGDSDGDDEEIRSTPSSTRITLQQS